MQIIGINTDENCLGQPFIKSVKLDSEITFEILEQLKVFGEVKVYDFARILFKVKREYYWELKGIVGNNYMQVIFNADELVNRITEFRNLFQSTFR